VASFGRLFVPHNDPRWLQRNALVAAGNTGDERIRPAVERHARGDDAMLAEHARWALERLCN
jgi:epoxyqueuosine reductase